MRVIQSFYGSYCHMHKTEYPYGQPSSTYFRTENVKRVIIHTIRIIYKIIWKYAFHINYFCVFPSEDCVYSYIYSFHLPPYLSGKYTFWKRWKQFSKRFCPIGMKTRNRGTYYLLCIHKLFIYIYIESKILQFSFSSYICLLVRFYGRFVQIQPSYIAVYR